MERETEIDGRNRKIEGRDRREKQRDNKNPKQSWVAQLVLYNSNILSPWVLKEVKLFIVHVFKIGMDIILGLPAVELFEVSFSGARTTQRRATFEGKENEPRPRRTGSQAPEDHSEWTGPLGYLKWKKRLTLS